MTTDNQAGPGRPVERLRRSLAVWTGAAVLIVAPILALRLISEPNELIFLGALTVATGVAYEVATRVPARLAYAAALALALFAAIAPTIINGAVGIVGSEDNDANRAFLAPPIVAGLASLAAILRARWMAWAMIVAAIAQAGVFAWLWAAGYGFTGPISVFFTAMWLIAGGLFRRAAAARILNRG